MTHVAAHYLISVALLTVPIGVRFSSPASQPKPDDFIFEVKPKIIVAGESVLLRWSIKGATKVLIEEATQTKPDLRLLGTFGPSGELRVAPAENTTYVISCEGSTTYSCMSVTVRVKVKRR